MDYTVQRGDTIAHVTRVLGSNWQSLKEPNPKAVGRSKVNGNWFLREGATVSVQPKQNFASVLKSVVAPSTSRSVSPSSASQQSKAPQAIQTERLHTLQAGETV